MLAVNVAEDTEDSGSRVTRCWSQSDDDWTVGEVDTNATSSDTEATTEYLWHAVAVGLPIINGEITGYFSGIIYSIKGVISTYNIL